MKFNELANRVKCVLPETSTYCPDASCASDPEISLFVSDSRKIVPGAIFACVKGGNYDGHDFAAHAASAGAAALFCERPLDVPLPQIICGGDIRRKMGLAAAALYGDPASKLTMIALTGTNGKTTSTYMTKSILEKAGIKTGLLGTVYNIDGVECEDAEHTTPEGSDLQTWLYKMVNNGCGACVMETSSHAVHQGRIDGVAFDRIGFTNLTVDHLDYHIDMESYFAAKRMLFEKYVRDGWKAAVNLDDPYGRRLYETFKAERVSGYGLDSVDALFTAAVKGMSVGGMDIEMTFPDKQTVAFRLPLLGEYNVLNALQAAAIAWSLEIPAGKCAEGLSEMPQVPGRLERYIIGGSGTCIIDFAHSPDGLEKVLTALRPVCKGKLITVFGAGGDRDNSKRPMMGEVASRFSDFVIVTSDNPRSEDPEKIAREVLAGAERHPTGHKLIVDRHEAIFAGLDMLGAGDIIVLAGKGPERVQLVKGEAIPFLDKEQVMEWAALRGKEVL